MGSIPAGSLFRAEGKSVLGSIRGAGAGSAGRSRAGRTGRLGVLFGFTSVNVGAFVGLISGAAAGISVVAGLASGTIIGGGGGVAPGTTGSMAGARFGIVGGAFPVLEPGSGARVGAAITGNAGAAPRLGAVIAGAVAGAGLGVMLGGASVGMVIAGGVVGAAGAVLPGKGIAGISAAAGMTPSFITGASGGKSRLGDLVGGDFDSLLVGVLLGATWPSFKRGSTIPPAGEIAPAGWTTGKAGARSGGNAGSCVAVAAVLGVVD